MSAQRYPSARGPASNKKLKRRATPARRAAAPPRVRKTRSRTGAAGPRKQTRTTVAPARLRVVPCSAEFAREVANVHKLAYRKDHFSSCLPMDALTDFYGGHIDANDHCLVALKNGNVVGFIIAGYGTGASTDSFVKNNRWKIISTLLKNPRFLTEKVSTVVASRLGDKKPRTKVKLRLLSIAVHPDYQGQGVASGLLNQLDRRLQAHGIQEYGLSLRKGNDGAYSVYKRSGFVDENNVNGTIYMKKDISAPVRSMAVA